MARERYLIGVKPEDLKPTPPPPPEDPTGWLENVWYHSKWTIIVAAFFVVLAAIGIYQLVSRDNPDYTIVLLTENPLTADKVETLQSQLAAYGEDVDEDGKVEVLIECLALGIDYSNQKIANDNTLMAHFAAGDVLIYAAEPEYYEKRILKMAGDYQFFTTLADGDEYVKWYPGLKELPGPVYIGVRNATGTAKENGTHDACMKLIESLPKKLTTPPTEN